MHQVNLPRALAALAFAAGCQALEPRQQPGCCFGLTATGGPGGSVAQLSDGQNRIGQTGLTNGHYCLHDGGLTDDHWRGCILTPPTTQWQCDAGAHPNTTFTVGCDGALTCNGDKTFHACPTGDHGGYNIYSQTLRGEPGCVSITLNADACSSGCPKPPPPPPPPTTTSAPASKTTTAAPPPPKATCPLTLEGNNWEFPHLIVPVDADEPTRQYGTSFNGTAGAGVSTIFNFDIPAADNSKWCKLTFALPTHDQLDTSAYLLEGKNSSVHFAKLSFPAKHDTDYVDQPAVNKDFGEYELHPGSAFDVAQGPCPGGQTVTFAMRAVGDTMFDYFQDFNPCAIGLYIVKSPRPEAYGSPPDANKPPTL